MTRLSGKIFILAFFITVTSFAGESIEEKRETLAKKRAFFSEGDIEQINQDMRLLKDELSLKYSQVCSDQGPLMQVEQSQKELVEINKIRSKIEALESKCRKAHVDASSEYRESYGFWGDDETTLSTLIAEYGSRQFLYIVPPEIMNLKIKAHSEIPIPRESWTELLEIILRHNGIGVKSVNTFAKQLFLLKQDLAAVEAIISNKDHLSLLPRGTRATYIFSPLPERSNSVYQFFDRFRDPKMTFIYKVGHKIAIISSKEEISKLLTLYDTVWNSGSEKVTKVIPVNKVKPVEMEKILSSYFASKVISKGFSRSKVDGEDLILYPLSSENALVAIGPKNLVARAEKVALDTERQIEDPSEMTVYCYNCRHSDPIDLSEVLEKVYYSLVLMTPESQSKEGSRGSFPAGKMPTKQTKMGPPTYGPPPYSPVVEPLTAVAGNVQSQEQVSKTKNFIPYPKTGAVMMVVRRDTLGQIKELIQRLDVPKKMVNIEVLLFERKIKNKNNFGLNLLNLGSAATQTHRTGLAFGSSANESSSLGILDFFISRNSKGHFYSTFDIAYNFLMSQEDVRINEAPSVTTLNQTPAQISIVQELSIDNGAAPISGNTGVVFQKSFSRAQYGTTLVITPTVHDPIGPEDTRHFITLETNISFDTINETTASDRPEVSRRHLENYVRVADGETIILGGLREKTAANTSNKIPFLGEIPGLGKFFGESKMSDDETEMFFFITPRVILDPEDKLVEFRRKELMKRPGDLPEFLEKIEASKERKKKMLFNNSFKLLFGHVK
ncbi:hypothetical protein COB21_02750 [Candidatus Aerophobetes bacterium]|uniref:Type II/III secretion system secretin-like domain-containing protein n=1 Tax=Aerophobetes bacterium TaxID=2030807 RepID=A0A2A4X562_UNCAE|nr:MAG: hypothetical protein COB21_02750 [Candidatus Aerophobetes bacterium]